MEDAHEEEIDEAQEHGNKELWKLFYQFKDDELLRQFPETSVDTIRRTGETLDSYMFEERVGIPPEFGGRNNQPEEWDEQLSCAYSAKAQAEEEIELDRKLKDQDQDDEGPSFDEEPDTMEP